MKYLFCNKKAQMGIIGAAIGLLITLIISILVYYNIAASVTSSSVEDNLRISQGYSNTLDTSTNETWAASNASIAAWNAYKPVTNATGDINDQATTFYTIAPIIVIVIVAVIVIGYVQRIGG